MPWGNGEVFISATFFLKASEIENRRKKEKKTKK